MSHALFTANPLKERHIEWLNQAFFVRLYLEQIKLCSVSDFFHGLYYTTFQS